MPVALGVFPAAAVAVVDFQVTTAALNDKRSDLNCVVLFSLLCSALPTSSFSTISQSLSLSLPRRLAGRLA